MGEVSIQFDQTMLVIPKLEMISKGKIKIDYEILPVFEIEVIAGDFSNPTDLDFEWDILEMNTY